MYYVQMETVQTVSQVDFAARVAESVSPSRGQEGEQVMSMWSLVKLLAFFWSHHCKSFSTAGSSCFCVVQLKDHIAQ